MCLRIFSFFTSTLWEEPFTLLTTRVGEFAVVSTLEKFD